MFIAPTLLSTSGVAMVEIEPEKQLSMKTEADPEDASAQRRPEQRGVGASARLRAGQHVRRGIDAEGRERRARLLDPAPRQQPARLSGNPCRARRISSAGTAARPSIQRQASCPKSEISGTAIRVETIAPRIHITFSSEPSTAPRCRLGAISAR